MSQFYNPNRSAVWNYGGAKWKLSRSKIDLFVECPRCFYIDNKLGTKRPPGYPFNLNSAVDHLLKKEFDIHRAKETTHPLMKSYGLDAVPFVHKDIDIWRDNFAGVQYKDETTGMIISGAIDDVWKDNKTGELMVVDYKATSKDEQVTLDAEWQDGYKRQMEVYQWLLRKNGFEVSDTGYFVYANGKKDREAFDGKLEFDVDIIEYTGNDDWVDDVIVKIHKVLEDPRVPKSGKGCDYCPYREVVGRTLQDRVKSAPVLKKKTYKKATPPDTGTLF